MSGLVGEHIVELKIADVLIDTWNRISVTHGMMSASDAFDMSFDVASWDPRVEPEPIIRRLEGYAEAFERVELFVDGAKQLTGLLDKVKGKEGVGGPTINLVGHDMGKQVEDEDLPKGFNYKNVYLLDLVDAVLGKYDVEVVIGNEDNRVVVSTKKKKYQFADTDLEWAQKQKWWKQVIGKPKKTENSTLTAYTNVIRNRKINKEVRPKPDDTRMSFLARLFKSQNLMGWFAADGKFIIGLPNYDQAPLFHITRAVRVPGKPLPEQRTPDMNNVEEGSSEKAPGQRYSVVKVFGRQGKTPIRAEAHDTYLEALEVDRPWRHTDHKIDSIEEAQRVADRILYESMIRGTSYDYTLTGFGQGDHLFAFDTVFDVWDDSPACNVHSQLYCTQLELDYDKDSGPTTKVKLQEKGIIEVPTS